MYRKKVSVRKGKRERNERKIEGREEKAKKRRERGVNSRWQPPIEQGNHQCVIGVPYGKRNSKVTTAPRTQRQSKDKDKFTKRIKTVKLNIINPESFTQLKFWRIDGYQDRLLFMLYISKGTDLTPIPHGAPGAWRVKL